MTNIETAGEPVRRNRQRSAISGKEVRRRDLFSVDTLRPSLVDRIRQDHPDLAPDALISRDELAHYRTLYVEELLKAKHEIRHLHEKMDHLISRQWQRLAEIQQLQIETMHELSRAVTSRKSSPT